VRYLGGALALAGVLALAACGSPTSNTSGTSSSSGTSTASGTSEAQAILTKTKQANLKDATFTVNQTITTTQGTVNSTGDGKMTTSPFSQDLTLSSSAGGQHQQTEVITKNTTVYAKPAGQAKWTEVSGAAAAAMASPALNDIATLPGATLVGTETINGVTVYHLRGTGTRSANGQTVPYHEDLWVNKVNGEPVKVVYHATASQGTADTTVSFTAWNTGVTIEQPPASEVTQATATGTATP
jgi:hypothetical protein